jgi:hypothetical protein
MSKQKDSGAALALDKAVHRWDFDKSVMKVRELRHQWDKMTTQITRELFLAKAFLTSQKKPKSNDENQYTWEAYCGAINMDRQFADYWINKFIPRELSDTNKDVLLIKAPIKTEITAIDRAAKKARMQDVLYTGEKPKDWTDEEDVEYRKIMRSAHFAEIAEKYNAPTYFKANDYFSEALKRQKDITNFKLDNPVYIQAQYKVFRYIEEYLNVFEDSEIQARAAFNIALRARNLSNEIAEKNFQIKNAQLAEAEDAG